MSITSLSRDWGVSPSIVRLTSTDSQETVTSAGYLLNQSEQIALLNNGAFEWVDGDMVAVSSSTGDFFATPSFPAGTLIPLTSGGGGSGLSTIEITTTSATLEVNTIHVINNASPVTLTLPETFDLGAQFGIVGKGAGIWTIAQNAGQQIFVGSASTTAGVSGSLVAAAATDSVYLVATTENVEVRSFGAPLSAGLTLN